MLATFAFDVCHDVYRAAREVLDTKIPTLSLESSGKYMWHPDRMPRLSEFVADFARAGERALCGGGRDAKRGSRHGEGAPPRTNGAYLDVFRASPSQPSFRASPSQQSFRASHLAMFRVYYLGGVEYRAARRHLGISELTWGDWADQIRTRVGNELTRSGVFPPSKYFNEASAQAS